MKDGIIFPNTDRGEFLGLTFDKFHAGSYLFKQGDYIYISFIQSKAKGNFKQLINEISKRGYRIKIPTPLKDMERIVKKNGYEKTIEHDPELGPIEVWVLPNQS